MFSRMTRVSALLLTTVLVLVAGLSAQPVGVHARPAKTLTITINGTLGPVLSGSDPLGANGQGGTLTVMASESLSPKKHTPNSATYILPPGAMTITVGSNQFKTKTNSTMMVKLTNSADILTLIASGSIDGINLQVTGTAYLKAGSWKKSVLKHPTKFSPSPQNLTSAQKSNGPGSKVKYTVFGSSTVLGLSGTASDSDAADAFFFGDDIE